MNAVAPDPRFVAAVRFTLAWEGGYCDNPADPGGSTNYGITQATLDAIRTRESGLPPDVRNLTVEQAQSIYQIEYWAPLVKLGLITDYAPWNTAVFDWAVNSGRWTTVDAADVLACYRRYRADGPSMQLATLALNNERRRHLLLWVSQKPDAAVFVAGWWHRVAALDNLALTTAETTP